MFDRILRILIFFGVLLISNSCYEEFVIVPQYETNIFSFIMSSETENEILESRGVSYSIEPVPLMYYGQTEFVLDKMKVRGQSALNFQRKSYSVNIDGKIGLDTGSELIREFGKFKLISMVYDYTYIENRLAHKLLQEVELWPLYSFYTKVLLDNNDQGLYLFIEDPESYLFQYKDAEIVLRRYYKNVVAEYELGSPTIDGDVYLDGFNGLYETIVNYSGQELYLKLSDCLNVERYMQKMAMDFILKNGDTTDEIFFYGVKGEKGKVYFDILPWDFDDLFESRAHEIGRSWAVGSVFGERCYDTNEQLLETLDGRLIFSIEDDIDYVIAMDDYLYQKYLIELKNVLSKITVDKAQCVFQSLYDELYPFYQDSVLIEQSQYDANATSLNVFETNFEQKKSLLTNRIQWINTELE